MLGPRAAEAIMRGIICGIPRRRLMLVAGAMSSVALVAGPAGVASASTASASTVSASTLSAASGPRSAVGIRLPSNANANPDALLIGVGCTGAGVCAAGGEYTDVSGHA